MVSRKALNKCSSRSLRELLRERELVEAARPHDWTVTLPCIICRWYLHQNA
jgi:hypothetical protein